MKELRFNLIVESSNELIFNALDLCVPGNHLFTATIWQRQGVYRVFTSSQMWGLHDEAESLVEQCGETGNPTVSLVWDRGTPMNKIVAETLLDK